LRDLREEERRCFERGIVGHPDRQLARSDVDHVALADPDRMGHTAAVEQRAVRTLQILEKDVILPTDEPQVRRETAGSLNRSLQLTSRPTTVSPTGSSMLSPE